MDPWVKPYHVNKDIWLSENPYTSYTVIKFEAKSEPSVDI